MNNAVQLTGAGDKEKRRSLDFYPTPPEATHALMDFLSMKGIIRKDSIVWEPACGIGSMSDVLKQYAEVVSSDINSTGYSGWTTDFLTAEFDCDAVITNPPFALSADFILHALKQAPVVAMLLKSQYWHAKSRVDLFNKNPPAWVLPLTWRPDFLFDKRALGEKSAPTMEVQWTVWIDGDWDTKYRLLKKPEVNHD